MSNEVMVIDESKKEVVEENKFKTFYDNLSDDYNLIRETLVESLKTNAEVQKDLKNRIDELCHRGHDDSNLKQINYFLRSYNDCVGSNMQIGTAIIELYTGVSKVAEKELPINQNYAEVEHKTEETTTVTTTKSLKAKIADFNRQQLELVSDK